MSMAQSERVETKKKQPTHQLQVKNGNNGAWITIGAAWPAMANGKECLSVKINFIPQTFPQEWRGDCLLVPVDEVSEY